jgi:ribosomal protein L7/L12
MPQIQVFQCPACGANLSYDGGPETSFACQFCGTTVIVPQEMRPASPPAAAAPKYPGAGHVPSSLPPDKLGQLKHLVRNGQKAEAVELYQEVFGVGHHEALAAVERMAAGGPMVVASRTSETPGVANDTSATQMAEALRLALSGDKLEAIKVYRAATGANLQEAKDAVEQMAAGQPADLNRAAPQTDAEESRRAANHAALQKLARSGQTIEAIKLYRGMYGVGLKEAKDAVDAMVGGTAAPPGGTATARRAGRAAGCGGLGCGLLFTAGIIGFVIAVMYLPFRMSGSFNQALDAARSNPAVVAALGAPVEASWWPTTGEISCGSTCSANYVIPIHGSRKSGRIIVQSDSKGAGFFNEGTWILDATVIVDNGPTVNLTPAPPPTPTPSALDVDATQGAVAKATQRAVSRATQSAQTALDAEATAAADLEQGTATAEADAQAQADAAATSVADAQNAVQTMEAAQAAWPPLVKVNPADPFHGWPSRVRQDSYIAVTSTVKATHYVWTVLAKQGNSYMNLMPTGSPNVTDFYAQVEVQFLQGDPDNTYAYGLVFRQQGSDYGFFGIENSGSFRALEVHNGGIYTELVGQDAAILTQPGDVNHLLVRSQDSNFVFVVNGVVVQQMTADYSDGTVGLGVDAKSKGKSAQVQFSNFAVYAPAP